MSLLKPEHVHVSLRVKRLWHFNDTRRYDNDNENDNGKADEEEVPEGHQISSKEHVLITSDSKLLWHEIYVDY